ncbi:MAG: PilX N-terminal domain-containing pilus assembly protein [bacterium]
MSTHSTFRAPGSWLPVKRAMVSSRSGSALIVALWTVILLSLIISSFAFEMHLEAKLASHYRKRMRAGYLAQAGMERARMLLVQSADPKIKDEAYEHKEEGWYLPAKNLARGSAVYGFVDTLDTGTATVDIVPEMALRNVNRLGPADWQKILEAGGIPEDQWGVMMDCFFDWTDADSLVRPYGAEKEYYSGLNPPYPPRNGPIFTVDELLLIKGFAPEVLDGGARKDDEEDRMVGIRDLLTVFGDGTVNVNVATRRVLMTLVGVDDIVADDILRERELPKDEGIPNETRLFTDPNDFFTRFPALRSQLQNLITTAAGTYRITSTGKSQGISRQISCVASVDRSKGSLTVLWWQESEGQ